MDTSLSLSNVDEWKECRSTIARLDGVLVDLRKYSFSLVTVLITASGFFIQNRPTAILPASVGIMVLITALFGVDRYYTMLLNGAVDRALNLEGPKLDRDNLQKDALTQVITVYAIDSLSIYVAPVLYMGLLVAALILASMNGNPGVGVWRSFAVCFVLIWSYFGYTEWRRPTGTFRRDRFAPKSAK